MPTKTLRPPARRPTRATFSEELRDAIDRDGRTPYAIGRAAGVDAGILSRFLRAERAVTSDTIDRLAAALDLHLGTPTKGRGRPRRDAIADPAPVEDAPLDETAISCEPAALPGDLAEADGSCGTAC